MGLSERAPGPSVLDDLLSDLCFPIMTAADAAFTAEQRAAFAWAPLMLVSTLPPRVLLIGFDQSAGKSVPCGAYDLPAAGGHALARFFERALGSLSGQAQQKILAIIAAGEAQLVASVRVDRREATCTLVAHHDRFEPLTLFSVDATRFGTTTRH
jgi:hypothetical protein